MKKVLILSNNDCGLFKFRKELIQAMVNQKIKVYAVFPEGEMTDNLKKMGCICCHIEMSRRGKNIFQEFRLLMEYKRIISRIRPDCVLTYTIKPNIYGGILCKILKIPYIANITGLGSSIHNKGILSACLLKIYRHSLKKASCIFFQNKENKSFFLKGNSIKENSILIQGSGVNLEENFCLPYPHGEDTVCFLFIGRIMKEKGIDEFLSAAKNIKKNGQHASFTVIGECEEDYEEQLESLTKKGIIDYRGFQSSVHPYIGKAHAIVLPSYHEGMSNVLLEAAAAGRPIIASDIAGCRETFEDGVSGFSVPVRDADYLEKKMLEFIELPEEKKIRMGMEGRKRMERLFDRKKITELYLREINKRIEE